ncbi:DUF305 domain-containing protein [Actinokineospora auranticolor]|uniref:Uncharacterized protein (DUF305 family) n=1 Tax=Actinokineospora auranticolor TaxID=155976 RepID=A0A2S6GQ19_9PSEU|nr:DUF305 domain-containing protein [Actinokineospora auranticolor]PPK67362.1 uncharacterized protein (DUF305 family) [Actinokineospora auranticolor]
MAVRRIVLGLLAAALTCGLAACTEDPGPPPNPVVQPGKPGEANRTLSPDEISSGVPAVPPNAADFGYAENMINHHQQAVDMTALAETRAQDASVKGLAARIGDTQEPEIGAMNAWLERNGKPRVDPHHSAHAGHHAAMPGMATPEQMDQLRAATGADFDKLFLQLMIRHHEGAIAMANGVQQDGIDVRVQEMADNIVAEQSDEIRRMRTMLGV